MIDGYLCSYSHFPFGILKSHVFWVHDIVDDVHLEHNLNSVQYIHAIFRPKMFSKPGLQCVIFILKLWESKTDELASRCRIQNKCFTSAQRSPWFFLAPRIFYFCRLLVYKYCDDNHTFLGIQPQRGGERLPFLVLGDVVPWCSVQRHKSWHVPLKEKNAMIYTCIK